MDNKKILLSLLCDDDEEIQTVMQVTRRIMSSSSGLSSGIVTTGCRPTPTQSFDYIALGALLLSKRNHEDKLQGYTNLVFQMNNLDFFKQFRMSHQMFDFILEELFPVTHEIRIQRGKSPIDNKVGLLITLWFLGHQTTYNEISQQFGISLSCTHNIIDNFTTKISKLDSKFIKWPTLQEIPSVEADFKSLSGFPNVIGAIDGCHVKIKAPISDQKDYLDRTFNHSVNLLAICDSNFNFTYINVGFPGSAHDQRVLNCSGIGKKLEENHLSLCYSNNYHIIGDSAFALKNYMMVPFKDNGSLTAGQLLYNTKLSQTRRVIENTFAWLKGRFRKLKYIDADLHRIPNIITSACVLHNISMKFSGSSDNIELDNSDTNNSLNYHETNARATTEAKEKRDAIVRDLVQT